MISVKLPYIVLKGFYFLIERSVNFQPLTVGSKCVIDASISNDAMIVPSEKDLNSEAIANFPRTFEYYSGTMIAASSEFICYPLKDGKIRILSRRNGSKGILKLESEQLKEIVFSPFDSNLLAVCLVNSICIFRISAEFKDLETVPLFCWEKEAEQFKSVKWSSSDPSTLFAVGSKGVYSFRLDKLNEDGFVECVIRKSEQITAFTLFPCGSLCILSTSSYVEIIDMASYRTTWRKDLFNEFTKFFVVGKGHSVCPLIITCEKEGRLIKVWDWKNWKCLGEVEFAKCHYGNQVYFDEDMKILFISSFQRSSIFACLLSTGSVMNLDLSFSDYLLNPSFMPSGAEFSRIVEFPVEQPVLSMLVRHESPSVFNIFTLQLKSIHNLSLSRKAINDLFLSERDGGIDEDIKDLIIQELKTGFAACQREMKSASLGKLSSSVEKSLQSIVERELAKISIKDEWREKLSPSQLKPLLMDIFKELFSRNIIPSFEAAISNMFGQINQTFSSYLSSENQRLSNLENKMDLILNAVSELKETSSPAVMHNFFRNASETWQKDLVKTISHEFRNFASPPSLAIENAFVEIEHLVQIKDYNTAIFKALSNPDSSLLIKTLHLIDPTDVFVGLSSRLHSTVTISLIQALNSDLAHNLEFRILWLRECLQAVDPKDPLISSYASDVLIHLKANIDTLIASAQLNPQMSKHLRLISILVRSLLR